MNTPMHRFKYTELTREQIASKLVQTASGPKCISGVNAAGLLATKDQDWDSILPPEQRSSRLAMTAAAND